MRRIRIRPESIEEPEINLIPFIDVLLVVLIFLMLSTTYSKYSQLKLNLPVAGQSDQQSHAQTINVSVSADGSYSINNKRVQGSSVGALMDSLAPFAANDKEHDMVLVINADAQARQQMVVNVLEAARRSGLQKVTFATQSSGQSAGSGNK